MFWIQRREHRTPNRGKGTPAGLSSVQKQDEPYCAAAVQEYAVGVEMAKGCQTVDIHEVGTC